MKRSTAALAAVLLSLFMLSGCTTLADARNARGSGPNRTYNADFDDGLENGAAGGCVHRAQERYILAQRGMTLFSYGENVAIFGEPVSARQTKVEVVSKRAMETNIFAADWAPELLQKLGLGS